MEIMNIEIEESRVEDSLNINADIPQKFKQQLKSDFFEIYLQSERPELPQIETTLHLKLKSHKIFHCSPRRLSYTEKIELKKIIDDLLKRKILRPSNVEYSSPIVLVIKKMVKFVCVSIIGF